MEVTSKSFNVPKFRLFLQSVTGDGSFPNHRATSLRAFDNTAVAAQPCTWSTSSDKTRETVWRAKLRGMLASLVVTALQKLPKVMLRRYRTGSMIDDSEERRLIEGVITTKVTSEDVRHQRLLGVPSAAYDLHVL